MSNAAVNIKGKDSNSKSKLNNRGNSDNLHNSSNTPDKRTAVIMIRGTIKVTGDKKETLKRLGLLRVNNLIIIPNKKENIGMIKKVKDYVTWGLITGETLKLLKDKRKPIVEKKDKLIFKLSPPKKGFERKGIKTPFSLGGALGNRKEKINALIKRML